MSNNPAGSEEIHLLGRARDAIIAELSKVIVGQQEVIEQLLTCLFAGGHCLITGAPGLAKTRAIKVLASVLQADLGRIQFTPDLLPSDVTGNEVYHVDGEQQLLTFQPGPIFANQGVNLTRADGQVDSAERLDLVVNLLGDAEAGVGDSLVFDPLLDLRTIIDAAFHVFQQTIGLGLQQHRILVATIHLPFDGLNFQRIDPLQFRIIDG